MYKVFFENSNGEMRCIGEEITKERANKIIIKFLEERNFKTYYQRRWNIGPNKERIDVGSHTEFFEIHIV